jgi:hypothetical protein
MNLNMDHKETDMNLISKTFSTALLIAGICAGFTGTLYAADTNTAKSIKPLQGISFNAGPKHGVGYFYTKAKQCQLVLTLADAYEPDDVQSLTVVRYEAAVPTGKSTSYSSTEGKTLEFTCGFDAQAMTLREVERIATGGIK